MAIDRLTGKKMDLALARDLTAIIDILTKNTQLLGGGVTENIGVIKGFNYEMPKNEAIEPSKSKNKPKDE